MCNWQKSLLPQQNIHIRNNPICLQLYRTIVQPTNVALLINQYQIFGMQKFGGIFAEPIRLFNIKAFTGKIINGRLSACKQLPLRRLNVIYRCKCSELRYTVYLRRYAVRQKQNIFIAFKMGINFLHIIRHFRANAVAGCEKEIRQIYFVLYILVRKHSSILIRKAKRRNRMQTVFR